MPNLRFINESKIWQLAINNCINIDTIISYGHYAHINNFDVSTNKGLKVLITENADSIKFGENPLLTYVFFRFEADTQVYFDLLENVKLYPRQGTLQYVPKNDLGDALQVLQELEQTYHWTIKKGY